MKTAWQLNEKGGDTSLSDEILPSLGERILLQCKQKFPDLTPRNCVQVQDHFLQFAIDLNSARHSAHDTTRPLKASATS
jgi:hypothetical protein